MFLKESVAGCFSLRHSLMKYDFHVIMLYINILTDELITAGRPQSFKIYLLIRVLTVYNTM
jgi:hypothetical protein